MSNLTNVQQPVHRTVVSEDGLEIIINEITKEVACSTQGYARLSGITQGAVSKRLAKLTDSSEKVKTAEILTTKGLKTVSLIPESLMAEWLIKDNPDVAVKLLQMGIRAGLLKMAGYSIQASDGPVEVQEPTVAGFLPMWREVRKDSKSGHAAFQNSCLLKKHPARHVHDLITVYASNKTARQSRELPLIEGDPKIGLNHQQSAEELALITETKAQYVQLKGKKGELWQQQVRRAFNRAVEILDRAGN